MQRNTVLDLRLYVKMRFKQFKDKEDYAEYLFLVKKYTSLCFSEASDILSKIKKVKANYKPEGNGVGM